MRYITLTGDSPEEVFERFLNKNNLLSSNAEFQVMEPGSRGFLGLFGKKPCKIRVSLNKDYYTKRGRIVLSELLEHMGYDDFSIEIIETKTGGVLNIISPDSNRLIGKQGQSLDALQHILEKAIEIRGFPVRLTVDIESYRKKMIETMVKKAVAAAQEVKQTGKMQKLDNLVAMVRKEIHKALKSIPGVTTQSKGGGILKSVLILPAKKSNTPNNPNTPTNTPNKPRRNNRYRGNRNNNSNQANKPVNKQGDK